VTRTNGASTAPLEEGYLDALRRHATHPGEEGLLDAYELGRRALEDEIGVLELGAVHRAALDRLLVGASEVEAIGLTWVAWEFFVEAVAPFEMSLRGFRTANLKLQSANEALARRTEQLERARAEADAERATLASVIASIGDGLLVFDAARTVQMCNDRVAELLGLPHAELVDSSAERLRGLLLAAAGGDERVSAFLDRVLSRRPERQSVEFETAGSPRRDLFFEAFPIATPDGEATGLAVRDLTAQRELDRAKDELVAVVSHELRSPLAAVCGFVELLLGRDLAAERRESHLRTVLQEARRLGALIDDFLDLQRIDRGAGRVEPVAMDVSELLERLRGVSCDQGDPFLLDVPEELPSVYADAERIWQVLLNLVGNARKYSPSGGEIRVRALPLQTEVEISVADQGLGIPAEALPRLFEDFYRIPGPEREGIPGTGLGLSICRKIVEAHGGRIWAESNGPGFGSRFAFTLPRAEG
jgi:signal transduction histidine kinase